MSEDDKELFADDEAGVAPPEPPPPPQAVIDPLNMRVNNSLKVFIYYSLVIIDLSRYYSLNRLHSSYCSHFIKSLPFSTQTPLSDLS
ncbi:MAG TPA: hypothetical protein VF433_02410 [Cellvibrio sp.]